MAIEVQPMAGVLVAAGVIPCGTCWDADRDWPTEEERAFPTPTWVRWSADVGEVANGIPCVESRPHSPRRRSVPHVVRRPAAVIALQGGRQLALCRSHAVMLVGEPGLARLGLLPHTPELSPVSAGAGQVPVAARKPPEAGNP
jgi:hypothetical protein